MSEKTEKRKTASDEAEEVRQILSAVSTEIPALIKRRVGSSWGTSEELLTMVWALVRKYSRNAFLSSAVFMTRPTPHHRCPLSSDRKLP